MTASSRNPSERTKFVVCLFVSFSVVFVLIIFLVLVLSSRATLETQLTDAKLKEPLLNKGGVEIPCNWAKVGFNSRPT